MPGAWKADCDQFHSIVGESRIEATVNPPSWNPPANLHLRRRHSNQSNIQSEPVNQKNWTDFYAAKERIRLPSDRGELRIAAAY
jgi:hypothetical protein